MRHKKTKKILYVSGTRADFGIMKSTLLAIKNNPKLELEIAATGMHLMDEFCKTINDIKKCGFKVRGIEAIYEKDNKESMANFTGDFILNFSKLVSSSQPDLLLVLGDRPEMLAASIVGTYFSKPIAHVHGGDVSSTVDDTARHAITKLSHIHFPATKKSALRIMDMGEKKNRIFIVGAPGLDDILSGDFTGPAEISSKYRLNLSRPVLIIIQHPVTEEISQSAKQMQETMQTVKDLSLQSIIIYPNADAGGRAMIKVIEKYHNCPNINIYKNIVREDYIGIMKIASVLIGNSSGGIIEAASFHLPVINIGTRQNGRERTTNVIDAPYDRKQIEAAVKKALFDNTFRNKVKHCMNPYGKGNAGFKIANILGNLEINAGLLRK